MQHACDPTLLSSMLVIAHDLLAYAQDAGLASTAALVSDSAAVIAHQLVEIRAGAA
jgi:hypothetical protein